MDSTWQTLRPGRLKSSLTLMAAGRCKHSVPGWNHGAANELSKVVVAVGEPLYLRYQQHALARVVSWPEQLEGTSARTLGRCTSAPYCCQAGSSAELG
jgi:hypothetical protein